MSPRLCPLLACAFAAAAHAQQAADSEFDAAMQWIETLGIPPVAGKPFVRVATGNWFLTEDESEQNTFIEGFLLDDGGEQFTVLTLDLDTRVFTRSPRGTAEARRVGYSMKSLRQYAQQAIQEIRAAAENGEPDFAWFVDRPVPSRPVSLFVLAWACRQAGEQQLAADLAALAKACCTKDGKPLRDVLARDLGRLAMWKLMLGFDDRERSFAQLLAECECLLQRFPGSEYVARAKATRQVLVRMVQEQEARPALPADAGEDARIAELVFRLRDQNSKPIVFADPRGEQSPAAQLAAHGYAAVPLLLPAFDDDSFTRCLRFQRDSRLPYEVLRVREVAAAVFARITGRWAPDRAEAERQWRDFQERGERAVLIDGTEHGNEEQAQLLLARYPDAALAALRKALDGDCATWQRRQLLAVLAGVSGDEAVLLLRAALVRPGDVEPRVTAAVALSLRGQLDVAVDAMVALWKQGVQGDAADEVGKFLAVCGVRRAIDALAGKCDRLGPEVLLALGEGVASFDRMQLPDGSVQGDHLRLGEPEAGADDVLEKMLALMLDGWRVFPGNFNGTIDPDLGDFAAWAMHQRWPLRYSFDFRAPRPKRYQQLLEVKNAWRQRQGLPPLPVK